MNYEVYQKLYHSGMFLMMAFVSFQVYQGNALKGELIARVNAVEGSASRTQDLVINHLIGHPGELSLPITAPLVNNPNRRSGPRIENSRVR